MTRMTRIKSHLCAELPRLILVKPSGSNPFIIQVVREIRGRWVAQATRLCRRATRPTEWAGVALASRRPCCMPANSRSARRVAERGGRGARTPHAKLVLGRGPGRGGLAILILLRHLDVE